jgi:hypothetical protein
MTYERHRAEKVNVEYGPPFLGGRVTNTLHISQRSMIDYETINARERLERKSGYAFAGLRGISFFQVILYRAFNVMVPSRKNNTYRKVSKISSQQFYLAWVLLL